MKKFLNISMREIRFIRLCLLIMLLGVSVSLKAATELGNLTTEYKKDPIGIDVTVPRFSWKLLSDVRDQEQTAYQILVASSPELLTPQKADLWNSQKVGSSQSVLVDYAGSSLKSRQRGWWMVRAWDKNGKATKWSKPALFEMGFLQPSDWQANWIKPAVAFEEYSHPAPYFRKEFNLNKPIKSARLYSTSRGLYEFFINGERVGDQYFTPGYTSYEKRLQYQVYDITPLLKGGVNATGAIVGNGWYRAFRPNNTPLMQHQDLELFAQLEVEFADGSRLIIPTDDSWKTTTGPLLKSEMYDGEIYDARQELTGWNQPGYDDAKWGKTQITQTKKNNLVGVIAEPVRKIEELKPIEIIYTPAGDTVLDMGQNMVGWCRLRVKAPKGTTIKLRHSEILDQEGNFYTANLRTADQEIIYTTRGGGEWETFEPKFSFQGFRYVAVSGYPAEVTNDLITGVVIHSDLDFVGAFSCNNELINQLQQNIVWSQRGNFLDIPSDCPQRDERLGWTADIHAFAPTAFYNMNSAAFLTKWLKDLAADQHEDGRVPNVIPDEPYNKINIGATGWADAATIVPWSIYTHYGDKQVLEDQYASMKGWVEYMRREAKTSEDRLYRPKTFQFNDWLAFTSTFPNYQGATTDTDFLAAVFYYHSTAILAKSAALLGKEQDAATYASLQKQIKESFTREFLSQNGRLSPNTQTAYVLALSFDLVPEELKASAAQRLANDVNKFGHITTGFLGVADISHVLTRYGHVAEAYKLLYRQKYPSWLYPVTKGATTIWERWDAIKPDGSFQTEKGNSFNHYAYGAVGDWLYKAVAGINPSPAEPGYKKIIFKPHPYGEMNDVKASHESLYGTIVSEWKMENGKFKWHVTVPPNTRAEVFVPASQQGLLINGKAAKATLLDEENALPYQFIRTEVGAGKYVFESSLTL
ncbi:alpha-L-rhamnosidase [Flammeovirgaceae bacterium 311]|nr:alpha-L-rhamnosidase [Flammeovirgaceae bacterium 311]